MSTALSNYLTEISNNVWANDPRMQNYMRKQTIDVYETQDGLFVTFENEKIEKNFAFGHGFCGVTTEEDTEAAMNAAAVARNNVSFFIRENLRQIDTYIETLQKYNFRLGLFRQYERSESVCYVMSEIDRYFEVNQKFFVRFITNEERQQLLDVALSVRAKRVKRLNTYLKRYGLSKVHSFTYLSD